MRRIQHLLTINMLLISVMSIASAGQQANMSIKDSTRYCEKAVVDFCKEKDCPTYCQAQKNPEDCLSKCATHCALKPMGKKGDTSLDAQNRDHLFACIAEKRDPEGKKSGRRMQPWQDMDTPSFAKLKLAPKKQVPAKMKTGLSPAEQKQTYISSSPPIKVG